MMLYPKKYSVNLSHGGTIYGATAQPQGVLRLTIQRCSHLIVKDMFSSDPYVIVSVGVKLPGQPSSEIKEWTEVGRTDVVPKSLNPTFGETFEILLYDKSVQFVKIQVLLELLTRLNPGLHPGPDTS
jgi:Ca2+-dependent lipid-binding protein